MGTVVASFIIFGLAAVAPPLPSIVMKSGCAEQANSKSSSICSAAS